MLLADSGPMRQLAILLIVALALSACGSGGSGPSGKRRVPVTVLRLDGKKIEPGYRFENGLRIADPKPGTSFMAGTTIPVVVEPTNGFAPREVWVSSPYEWKDCLAQPFKAELKIPMGYLGPL